MRTPKFDLHFKNSFAPLIVPLRIFFAGFIKKLCCLIYFFILICHFRKLYKLHEITSHETNEFYCSKEKTLDLERLFDAQQLPVETSQDFRHNFRNVFKECIEHHWFVLDCLKSMERFYNPIWFLKTGQAILLLCLVAFVSVKVSKIIEKIKICCFCLPFFFSPIVNNNKFFVFEKSISGSISFLGCLGIFGDLLFWRNDFLQQPTLW